METMQLVPKYREEIEYNLNYDLFKNNMDSYTTYFLKESMSYIDKYYRKLREADIFRKDYSRIESILTSYYKSVENKITEYINKIVQEQKEQISKDITRILDEAPNRSISDIETMIFNAKNNIKDITRDKVNVIDGMIEDSLDTALREYCYNAKRDLQSEKFKEMIPGIVKDQCANIQGNLSSVKNKYVSDMQGSIEFFYNDSLYRLRDMKNEKKDDDFELKGTSMNTEIDPFNQEHDEENKMKWTSEKESNKVKYDDLHLGFTDIETLETFIKSIGYVSLSVEEGYLIVKDQDGQKLTTTVNDKGNTTVLKIHTQNGENIGVDIDPESKSICVKKGDESNKQAIAYSSSDNEMQVSLDGTKYIFRFENSNTKLYTVDESGKEIPVPDKDVYEIIAKIEQSGITIMNFGDDSKAPLNYCIDESKDKSLSGRM